MPVHCGAWYFKTEWNRPSNINDETDSRNAAINADDDRTAEFGILTKLPTMPHLLSIPEIDSYYVTPFSNYYSGGKAYRQSPSYLRFYRKLVLRKEYISRNIRQYNRSRVGLYVATKFDPSTHRRKTIPNEFYRFCLSCALVTLMCYSIVCICLTI